MLQERSAETRANELSSFHISGATSGVDVGAAVSVDAGSPGP
jgi:hypothetical protein